ncbi:unnamed protein product [Trypanosoma congolense IL3000]|uniref:WGS project CAEQ00000000 data, annotated contig 2386 n=1 Tax=Trypanosoma congolense (strain IL3000) TaxID=1068625 RepID=F9WDN7_TRYCI|nr:unnamed protein product [Trypanosoma congolense IL3000]
MMGTLGGGTAGAAPAGFGTANTSTATSGFGAPAGKATTGGGFGTSNTGGFGTGATTGGGFGTGATTGGFGTSNTGGFGTSNTGGFGTGATTGGFGTGATTGGFGGGMTGVSGRPTVMGAAQQSAVACQSALARYLLEFDNAYNAMHPNCRFRAFLYNLCTPGQSMMAVERERLIYTAAGGDSREEDLLRAQQRNPDPVRMYPTRVHFMQELKARMDKQKEMLAAMLKHVDSLISKAEYFRELDEENGAQFSELVQEQAMLQRRWYTLLRKVETLRQLGVPLAEESRIGGITNALSAQLAAPDMYRSALKELQPFLDAESAMVTSLVRRHSAVATDGMERGTAANSGALLNNRVDRALMRDWVRYAERIQQGVESLNALLERDTRDMRAIHRHLVSS